MATTRLAAPSADPGTDALAVDGGVGLGASGATLMIFPRLSYGCNDTIALRKLDGTQAVFLTDVEAAANVIRCG